MKENLVLLFRKVRDLRCLWFGGEFVLNDREPANHLSMLAVSIATRRIFGPRSVQLKKGEVRLICVVRDGEEYLPSFMKHYTDLGVKHFVFLDNGSADKTKTILEKYSNVTLLECKLPYRTYIRNFRTYLKKKYCRQGWSLFVDIDHLFDYPCSESLPLTKLIEYLDRHQYNAVLSGVLEKFANAPLSNIDFHEEDSLQKKYPYYDIEDISKKSVRGGFNTFLEEYYDGVAYKAFGFEKFKLLLHQYPLFRMDQGLTLGNGRIHDVEGDVRLADFSAVLYHFQFTFSLAKRCESAIKEENYAGRSSKYKKFFEHLQQKPLLNIFECASAPKELKDTIQLVEDGFLKISDRYKEYAQHVIRHS